MDRKTMFVTGAGSGLGREVARYFAEKGYFVGLSDVNMQGVAETASMIAQGQSSQHELDVTDRAQWGKGVAEFSEVTGGRMDVLFNNAGIASSGPIQEMDNADIDLMIAINFTGVVAGIQTCFNMLKNTPDSCVLNTSSAAGIYGAANISLYSATKFAVRGLTEAHDIEFQEYDIKSRSLMPGFIDTNILSSVANDTNMSSKEILQSSGIEISPVSIIGPAAWEAVHGKKVHTTVNKTAKDLAFAARWFPGRLRKKMHGLTRGADKSLV